MIAEKGNAICTIVAPKDELIRADIDFFTNAVAECADVLLPVVSEEAKGPRIVFEIEKRNLFTEDDYAVEFSGAEVMRIRGSDQSCRWALNRILEDFLGVVFCYPGTWGAHYPKRENVRIPLKGFSGTMGIKLERDLWSEDLKWQRAMGGKRQTGEFKMHNLKSIFPIAKYAKSPWRERIMPEINGERIVPKFAGKMWQNCYANEYAVSEAVKNISAHLRTHPGQKVYALSINDNGGHCRCAACVKLNGGSFPKHSRYGSHESHSESYYQWVNKVVGELTKEFPDVLFGLLAYRGTIDPPSFRLHSNVVPFLCVDLHQLMDAKRLENRHGLFRDWSEKATSFGIWDYGYGGPTYVPPRDYLSVQRTFFQLKKQYPALNAFFAEGSSFIGEGPKRWWYYKLMADPFCDGEATLSKWYEACCGEEAAPYLKSYYDEAEAFWTGENVRKTPWFRTVNNTYLNFNEMTYLFALDESVMARMDALMDKVVAAAERSGDERQRIRARHLREFQDFYAARARFCGAYLTDPSGRFPDAESAAKFVAALPDMARAKGRMVSAARKVLAAREPYEPASVFDLFREWDKWVENFNPNFVTLFNNLIPYLSAETVRAALEASVADRDVPVDWKAILKGLLDPSRAKDLACVEDVDAADDLANWGKRKVANPLTVSSLGNGRYRLSAKSRGAMEAVRVVSGVPEGHSCLYRVRMTNDGVQKVSVTLHYLSAALDFGDTDPVGMRRTFVLAPGTTESGTVFCRMRPGSTTARLHFEVRGLTVGQSVTVDEMEFRDLESVEGHVNCSQIKEVKK